MKRPMEPPHLVMKISTRTGRWINALLGHVLRATPFAVFVAADGLAAEESAAEEAERRVDDVLPCSRAAAADSFVGQCVEVSGQANEFKDGGMAGSERREKEGW